MIQLILQLVYIHVNEMSFINIKIFADVPTNTLKQIQHKKYSNLKMCSADVQGTGNRISSLFFFFTASQVFMWETDYSESAMKKYVKLTIMTIL